MENISDASRLPKILSEDPGVPEFLMHTDGSFTKNSNKTLELLMITLFPGCKYESNEELGPQNNSDTLNQCELVVSIIN